MCPNTCQGCVRSIHGTRKLLLPRSRAAGYAEDLSQSVGSYNPAAEQTGYERWTFVMCRLRRKKCFQSQLTFARYFYVQRLFLQPPELTGYVGLRLCYSRAAEPNLCTHLFLQYIYLRDLQMQRGKPALGRRK